jgi:hypothetical protein
MGGAGPANSTRSECRKLPSYLRDRILGGIGAVLEVERPHEGSVTSGADKTGSLQDRGHTLRRVNKGAGIYFGTPSGTLFYSRDAGDSWHVLAERLPPIYGVSAGIV